jgi:type IV secretory pathway VirJ component
MRPSRLHFFPAGVTHSTCSANGRARMSLRRHRHVLPQVVVVALCTLAACQPGVSERIFQGGRFGTVSLLVPEGTPDALVFVFSNLQGWDAAYAGVARTLARRGAVVVGVDLPQYLRNLAASSDGCHYVVAEIEDMSERLQRDFQFAGYQSPILAGIGPGGTLAYAALAQSPAATIGGAISVDPAPVLGTRVPLCAGAPAEAAQAGGFVYGAQPKLNGWWRVSAAPRLSPQLVAVVEQSNGTIADVHGEPLERLLTLIRDALPSPTRALAGPLAHLSLTELPALRPGPAMAVIYSGDGGWRDIDKQIGEILARKGMPVVGVDSLRYFWREKPPAEIARQLSQIIRHYAVQWATPKVVLIGYSFGAGILPFAVNHLPAEDRARVVQVSLLGLEPHAVFEVKLSGWFGGEPGSSAPAVLPEMLRQPLGVFQCFYGEKEEDTLCTAPELAGAEIIRTGGGHHFGGDYTALAEKIFDGAQRRLKAAADHR